QNLQNLPIPGIAYEFERPQLQGILGFPVISLKYTPIPSLECELYHAALTDVRVWINYRLSNAVKWVNGFAWTNESWLRADRTDWKNQFFYFEKRLQTGVTWQPARHLDFQLLGGYAFDRYFTETMGFSIEGQNTVRIGSGPFVDF